MIVVSCRKTDLWGVCIKTGNYRVQSSDEHVLEPLVITMKQADLISNPICDCRVVWLGDDLSESVV